MKNSILKKSLLISLIFSILFSSSLTYEEKKRNLQDLDYIKFSSNSIYYKLEYMINDITGTGNKLKDIPYRS